MGCLAKLSLTFKKTLCSYREAYAQGKKERPPFVPRDQSSSEDDSDPIPDELLCPICNDLMTDAVVIPCCGNSYCDECEFLGIRTFSCSFKLPKQLDAHSHTLLWKLLHRQENQWRVMSKMNFLAHAADISGSVEWRRVQVVTLENYRVGKHLHIFEKHFILPN